MKMTVYNFTQNSPPSGDAKKVYFDNAATTQPCGDAVAAAVAAMNEGYGNPSSTHFLGRRASAAIEEARSSVAAALGAKPQEVSFTSGGTEADNWAILGACELQSRRGRHIITSETEHDAVLKPIKKLENAGWEVTYLAPDHAGRITAESFAAALRDDTVFASVMLVNNEIGAVNPVSDFSSEIRRRKSGALLHTDAVQGFCKIPFTVKSLGADLLTVSAHKIHGIKGAGALYVRNGLKLPPLILGGGQERGLRAGTEPVPAIAAFGAAARLGALELTQSAEHVKRLRDFTVERLAKILPESVILGDGDSPFILSLSLPGYKSEVLMTFLEGEGICTAKSAACKKGASSRVLEAMKLKNSIINGAIRVSFSQYNTQEECEHFAETLKTASEKLLRVL